MSYISIVDMAGSQSLLTRVVACAAQEGQQLPLQWAQANIWTLAAAEDWVTAWDEARANPSPNVNPDTGARTDVVSDELIRTGVQAARAALL